MALASVPPDDALQTLTLACQQIAPMFKTTLTGVTDILSQLADISQMG